MNWLKQKQRTSGKNMELALSLRCNPWIWPRNLFAKPPAALLLSFTAKTVCVVSFLVCHQGKCTPSTAATDADKDPEWFQQMHSEKNHQHICSTCSLDSHRCNKKAQQWIQLHDTDFGIADPQECMDLTQEGHPHMWAGKDAMLWATEAPLKDAATVAGVEDGVNEKTGWVLFDDVVFVHECADKRSNIGGELAFGLLIM